MSGWSILSLFLGSSLNGIGFVIRIVATRFTCLSVADKADLCRLVSGTIFTGRAATFIVSLTKTLHLFLNSSRPLWA